MKHILTIIVLASALAWTSTATGIVTHHSRSNEVADTATPPFDPAQGTPAPTAPAPEATTLPACGEGEYYDSLMERCRRPEDGSTSFGSPAETPAPPEWGPDVQATMDANAFDNDYQYIDICWDYVDGGTRIISYPCKDGPPVP